MSIFSLNIIPTWLWWLILLYLVTPLLAYFIVPYLINGTKSTKKRIIIYVLGDIGHSPRICYHTLSFADLGWEVELCGYIESEVPISLIDSPNVTIHEIPVFGKGRDRSIILMVQKVLFQVGVIIKQLWELRGSDYILLQNPPSIPILPIAVCYKLVTRCKLIIDWHNLAFSILQLKFHGKFYHPLVLISFTIEFMFSKFADYNLTVTKAMKEYLVSTFRLKADSCTVLYDRPAAQFTPLNVTDEERMKLIHTEKFIKDYIPEDFDLLKGDKIIVTSTSFTPDEDIGILLGALKIYENSYLKFDTNLPKILCFITGKGPLKEHFVKQVAEERQWDRCHVEFVWLTAEDYPKLLRLCDYGVSLHTSSSGLDLPMKILDMFGSGLPVLAMDYPVLNELVTHEINGLKFSDRRELHESLIFAMKDQDLYKKLRNGAEEESRSRWNSSWERSMKELKIVH